jgi:hypothetical protein
MNCVKEDVNIETAGRDSIDQDTNVLQPLDSGLPFSAAASRGWTNGGGCGKIIFIASAYCVVRNRSDGTIDKGKGRRWTEITLYS